MSDDFESGQTSEPEAPPAARDPWELALERLRARFPDATTGTLFCVHKLELDPQLGLRDFRDEASLRGIPLSGRSVHSAKVLLGMERPSVRRMKPPAREAEPVDEAPPRARPKPQRRFASSDGGSADSLEATLVAAVQQLQSEATARSQRLRAAIENAIELLRDALEADGES